MARQTEVVQARLRRDDPKAPDQREALRIFAHWREQGVSARDIVTQALLLLDGREPCPPDGRQGDSGPSLDLLREEIVGLKDWISELMVSIRAADPEGLRRFANAEPDTDDVSEEISYELHSATHSVPLDDEFLRNAGQAANLTLRQRQERSKGLNSNGQ